MASDGSEFYVNLPTIEDFFDASNDSNYHSLPDNWHVAVTDIVNSTAAIDDDRYKTVNILGASPIIGILNVAGKNKIPYIFAGDGSAFCIPPNLVSDARKVLAGSRSIGKAEYNLDLRAAIIPVSYIREQGHDLKVARYRASDVYVQAIFSGGGISYAEELLKKPGIDKYRIEASDNVEAVDFTGLECRWQKVKQQGKEVITLLVQADPQADHPEKIYKQVLHKMRTIFGFDDKTNPIAASNLSMTMSVSELMGEIKFRTFGLNWFQRLLYLLKAELQIILGKIFMALDYKSSATDWSLYKPDMALNSDHRKFDDMLRVVISGTSEQREELESFLHQRFEDSDLAYGMHVTDAAMITCMVFQYHRDHVHFVDGSDGGYVAAAKQLKERLDHLA